MSVVKAKAAHLTRSRHLGRTVRRLGERPTARELSVVGFIVVFLVLNAAILQRPILKRSLAIGNGERQLMVKQKLGGITNEAWPWIRLILTGAQPVGMPEPSPTIGQCLNGGLGWLEVECNRCKTRASLPSLKSVFQVHGIDAAGGVVTRRQSKRLS